MPVAHIQRVKWTSPNDGLYLQSSSRKSEEIIKWLSGGLIPTCCIGFIN